jgi:hypothetical protein
MDAILKQKLKRLIEHSDWEVVYAFQAKVVEKWNESEVKRETEFDTIWAMAHREGKKEGLKEFFDSAEKLALDTE